MDLELKDRVAMISGVGVRVGLGAAHVLSADAADRQGHLQSVADERRPIGRLGSIEELAKLFVPLYPDRASYAAGPTCFVDGGLLRTI